MDYRRFLKQPEERLAPVVGGHAWLTDRRVRIEGEVADGWWRVQVQGRTGKPIAAATAEAISETIARLPRAQGHLLRTRQGLALVDGQAGCRPLELAAAGDEPPLLAPLNARRWPIGDLLLWEELAWEGEVEETARRALEDRVGLAAVKGAPASLRAAFAFSAVETASRALNIAAQPGRGEALDGGDRRRGPSPGRGGVARAGRRACAVCEPTTDPVPAGAGTARRSIWRRRWKRRCGRPGARYLSLRRLGGGTVEVRWMFQGQRLISLVAEQGLRIIDSGLCLSGEDDRLTLDSLPGVVRQAIEDDVLVITRHE